MVRIIGIGSLLVLAVGLSGCQCRNCNQPIVNPLSGFGSPRITPPETFSFQPNGQPNTYYNSNSTANLPGFGLPNGNGSQANPNWRPVGNSSSAVNVPNNNYVFNPPPGYPTQYSTVASNGSIRSTDYRTTSTNELNDPSRMPVSDSSVQVPARFVPNGNFAQNQPIQIQGQYQYQAQPRLYSIPSGVLASSSTAAPFTNGYANQYGQVQTNWQATGRNNLNR